ncbi:MAG: tetratricopeptide repeat protein [Armatimonadetes bacterium]|nr:tetratricopeptide repeat protein [Armatimonadota bacterium]
MELTPEALGIIVRVFKAFVFVPVIALVAWWIISNWLVEQTLNTSEAAIGLSFVAVAFFLGWASISSGGWGFLAVLAFIYVAGLSLLAWQYIYWRQREKEYYLGQVEKFHEAIEQDPSNIAAYSFLGEAYLRLGEFAEAEAALETALEMDPESKRDRRLLQLAKEGRTQYPWMRTD